MPEPQAVGAEFTFEVAESQPTQRDAGGQRQLARGACGGGGEVAIEPGDRVG